MIPWWISVATFILGTFWGLFLIYATHRIGEELRHGSHEK